MQLEHIGTLRSHFGSIGQSNLVQYYQSGQRKDRPCVFWPCITRRQSLPFRPRRRSFLARRSLGPLLQSVLLAKYVRRNWSSSIVEMGSSMLDYVIRTLATPPTAYYLYSAPSKDVSACVIRDLSTTSPTIPSLADFVPLHLPTIFFFFWRAALIHSLFQFLPPQLTIASVAFHLSYHTRTYKL